jgi:hypothetical protein
MSAPGNALLTTETTVILIALTAAAVMALALAVVLIAVVASVLGEDRHGDLPHHAPTAVSRCVRRLTGLRVCQSGEAVLEPPPFKQKATSRADRGDPASSPGQAIDQPPTPQTGNRRSA